MDDGGLPVRSPPKSTAAALPMAQRGPRKTPSCTPLLPRTVWSGTCLLYTSCAIPIPQVIILFIVFGAGKLLAGVLTCLLYTSMDEYYEHLRADNIEAFSKERNDEYVGRAEEIGRASCRERV